MLILCFQAVCNNEKNNLDNAFPTLYFGCCLLLNALFQCPILDTYINNLQRNLSWYRFLLHFLVMDGCKIK